MWIKWRKWIKHPLMQVNFVFYAVLLGLESVSALSFVFLGISEIPLPWSLLIIIQDGFFLPVVIALLLTGLLFFSISHYFKTGIHRWYAFLSVCILGAALLGTVLSLVIFKLWTKTTIPLVPWDFFLIALALPQHSLILKHFMLSFAAGFTVTVFSIFVHLIGKYSQDKKVLGDAHFASAPEIKKAGFFEEEGFIVGKSWGKWLRAGGFEHVLVFAPTGSGKTRSISIPNLLTFQESAVVNDNKLTLFKTTSKYREEQFGHRCYLWALSWSSESSIKTFRYNPFSLIPENPLTRIKEIQRFSHILIPNGKGDPIWYQASRKLFKAIMLYVLDVKNDSPKTLGEVARLLKQPQFDDWLLSLLEETTLFDPEFYRNGFSYIQNHPKTRSSILETLTGYFELFDDPIIDAATSGTDFDIRALRKEKTTIYVGFSDDDMDRLSPLITLFWEQVISAMIQEIPDTKVEPYSVMFLMDEFSSLKKIDRLRRALKLLREYRVRCIIMIQYIAQTFEKYTHDEAKAFTNIKTKIAFAPDGIEDAEYVSKLLGNKTQKVKGGSASSTVASLSTTTSFNYQSVPLKRPEQVMRLKSGKTYLICSGHAPVYATQCIWYKEPLLKHLSRGESLVPSWPISQVPFIRSNNTGRLDEETSSKEEENYLLSQENEKKIRELEIEKMKVQADAIASAVINAVGSFKQG